MRVSAYERKVVRSAALLGVLAALLAFTGCKEPAPQGGATNTTAPGQTGQSTPSGSEIVIGEYGSVTGTEATFGQDTHDGVTLATEELNNAGGINGRKVRVELEDDQSDAPKAETAVKRLIDEKNVIAVLGEVASGNSLAGGRVCQEKGVPMISPSSTKPSVTEIGDYIFRVCFIDPFQAAVVARFANDGLKAKKVAIFTNKGMPYSVGFSDDFKKAFLKMGGQIVSEQSYGKDDKDFRGPLTSIKSANPDAILVPGYYTDAGSVVKQARELGITVPILGGDGWDSDKLFEVAGDAVNGCYYSNHMSVDDPGEKVQKFVQAYQAKFNKKPGALAALAYDAANLLFAAMKTAGTEDKKAIRDAIAATKDFDGVTGKITMDANRNASKPAVIIGVKDKQRILAASISDTEQPISGPVTLVK